MIGRGALVLLLLASCKGDGPNEERKLPNLHPPPAVTIPPDVRIAVEIDGAQAPDIDARTLADRAPDFADTDRAAWRLDGLLPAAAAAGVELAAEGRAGVVVVFRPRDKQVPVLLLNRRGALHVQAVDPDNPFPRYHGEGGRMRRPPGDIPQVSDVTRIAVTRPKPE